MYIENLGGKQCLSGKGSHSCNAHSVIIWYFPLFLCIKYFFLKQYLYVGEKKSNDTDKFKVNKYKHFSVSLFHFLYQIS